MADAGNIIPPEIKGDEFYHLIQRLAREEKLSHVLEIGSSSGGGSTEAFVNGLKDNPHKPNLYCLEVSKPRFDELTACYRSFPFVKTYNVSSVPRSAFYTATDVRRFYSSQRTTLNQYPLERVLYWLQEDLKYIAESGSPENGIEIIKKTQGLTHFDLVLIDGSAFTGEAELEAVYGSEIILLDDINDIKCLRPYERLKADPNYQLECENWSLRNGYAMFRKRKTSQAATPLPVEFFTIVLNGEPFIRHHIEVFEKLPFPWRWHIIEGVANLRHDTGWSLENGARITDSLHKNGLSKDGTSEYLDELTRRFPEQVQIYRKPRGEFWDGKLEMVNAPLSNIKEQSLLVQVDSDELWSVDQLIELRRMFQEQPERYAAYFYATYFVGEDLLITSRNTYGNNTGYEWLRAWRFLPGSTWDAHEPPRLCVNAAQGRVDLAHVNPFTHAETEARGLVFQHYAYVTQEQLAFKEHYYGYAHAITQWQELQREKTFPRQLKNYFKWVKDEAVVSRLQSTKVRPLAIKNEAAEWRFKAYGGTPADPREILIVRDDQIGDLVLATSLLPSLRKHYPTARISIACQESLTEVFRGSPFIDRVIPFNKNELLGNQQSLHNFLAYLQTLSFDFALNTTWSPDLLSHLITLGSAPKCSIGHRGNFSNISQEEQTKIIAMYSLIAEASPEATTELDHHQDLLGALGATGSISSTQLWLSAADERAADEIFTREGLDPSRTIAFFAGFGRGISAKYYDRYGEVLKDVCARHGLSVIALGAPEDYDLNNREILNSGARAVNLSGKTSLKVAAALIKKCRIALGGDTGLAHIACAVGTPQALIVGGGHFGRFFPYSKLTTVAAFPLHCFNCNWGCTFSRPHCVADLSPATIIEAFDAAYKGNNSSLRVVGQRDFTTPPQEDVRRPSPCETKAGMVNAQDVQITNTKKDEFPPYAPYGEAISALRLLD